MWQNQILVILFLELSFWTAVQEQKVSNMHINFVFNNCDISITSCLNQ